MEAKMQGLVAPQTGGGNASLEQKLQSLQSDMKNLTNVVQKFIEEHL